MIERNNPDPSPQQVNGSGSRTALNWIAFGNCISCPCNTKYTMCLKSEKSNQLESHQIPFKVFKVLLLLTFNILYITSFNIVLHPFTMWIWFHVHCRPAFLPRALPSSIPPAQQSHEPLPETPGAVLTCPGRSCKKRLEIRHDDHVQWIGLRENLNRKPWFLHVFTIKYRAFRLKFSHHPILWSWWFMWNGGYINQLNCGWYGD